MANLEKKLKIFNWGSVKYNVGWSENDFTNALKAKLDGIEGGAQKNIIEKVMLNGQEVAATEKTINLGQLQKMLIPGTGIAIAEDGTISTTLDVAAFKVVESLPAAPAAGNESKIHVVLDAASQVEGNSYAEYLWDGSKWELIGKFKAGVDLSDYAKTADVNAAIEVVNQTIAANKQAAETGIQEAKTAASEAGSLAQNAKAVADANKTKLDGISEGANRVTASYDEATATLTINVV